MNLTASANLKPTDLENTVEVVENLVKTLSSLDSQEIAEVSRPKLHDQMLFLWFDHMIPGVMTATPLLMSCCETCNSPMVTTFYRFRHLTSYPQFKSNLSLVFSSRHWLSYFCSCQYPVHPKPISHSKRFDPHAITFIYMHN